MGKLRDKLNRVNAPRPTELPSGATSVSAEEQLRPDTEAPAPAPPRHQPAPGRTFHLPSPAPVDAEPVNPQELESQPEQIPRFRDALKDVDQPPRERGEPRNPQRSSIHRAKRSSDESSSPTRRDALDSPNRSALKRGRAEPESVFRARDFKRWRKERSEPALEAIRESESEEPVVEPDDLILEREEGPPVASEDYLRAARIEVARSRVDQAVQHLLRARELPMTSDVRWSVTRMLAELLVDGGHDDAARPLLEELCAVEHGDPYPLVVLSEMLSEQEPERSAELRAAAKRIAPWLR